MTGRHWAPSVNTSFFFCAVPCTPFPPNPSIPEPEEVQRCPGFLAAMPWFPCDRLSRQIHVATGSNESVQRHEVLYTTHCFYSTNCRKCVGILRSLKDHLSSSHSNVFTVPGMLLLQFSHLLQSTESPCAHHLSSWKSTVYNKSPAALAVIMSMHHLCT